MSTIKASRQLKDALGEYNEVYDIDIDGLVRKDLTIAAAKAGSLSVRTNNTQGTIAFAAGHGFISTDKVDIYWTIGTGASAVAYSRRQVVVTMTGDNAAITGGSGDNLPVITTVINGMKTTVENFVVTGNDATVIAVKSAVPGTVTFYQADGTSLIKEYTIGYAPNGSGLPASRIWDSANGVTNPLAGAAVGKVAFSHGTTSAQKMEARVNYD